ncbi:MAG: TraY domain-containing protein [Chthoniobacterales bacterium]
MSSFEVPQKAHEDLPLPDLSAEVREALFESAQRNGRTVHEEAEHIIKSHLAASIKDED